MSKKSKAARRSKKRATGWPWWVQLLVVGILSIVILTGVMLLMHYLIIELGIVKAIILAAGIFIGTVCGQAKEAALGAKRSKKVARSLLRALKVAYADEHGPAFIFRLLEWLALAVAAALIAALITSSGTELTISEEAELTLPSGTEILVPSEGERTLPEGTKLTLSTEIEITLPPEIKLIVPTAAPSQ